MTKLFLSFTIFLSIFSFTTAQILKPVKWSSKLEKNAETEYTIILTGTIDADWHLYSQFTPDGGPLPLVLNFKNQKPNYALVGAATESAYTKKYNDVFEVDEYYFTNTVTIKQKIKITNPATSQIFLRLEYQVCKEVCINDSKEFTFNLPSIAANTASFPVKAEVIASIDTISKEAPKQIIAADALQNEPATTATEQKNLWSIFIFAFLGGLTALLTPCVFPMIPMTVSFFLKQSKKKSQGIKNAFIYGFSIIAIYVVLGLAINAVFGADALNALSTNPWFNVAFFVLLVVFAASFLGAFEIMLPNSWANSIDKQADKGGIIGILFMALALAIVSFSCTGPIVGTLLVESASKGGIAPVVGMLGFSSALALPFMLFALFPNWLKSLPKSGGWLNSVKVSLGFLELAFAFKFLSNADLVLQLHLLEREVFLAIWIAIFLTWSLYLFGKITLPHDSSLTSISVARLLLAVTVFSFSIYLVPGLFGAPLKLISAFPPPQTYSESPQGFTSAKTTASKDIPEGAEIGPHGIIAYTDYALGLLAAKKANKPILIDFTGYACVNCRKMENNVWSNEQVLKILKNEVILISLYLDDKRELPAGKQYTSIQTGEKITTIGDKWTDFIISKYKTNTQPYYVLINVQEQNLNTPISYTPDANEYYKWLKSGIANF